MSINAIKINLARTVNRLTSSNKKELNNEENDIIQQTMHYQKTVNPNDIFKYMSTQNPISIKKELNVNAYIDNSSAKRIESSMKDFEKQFSTKLAMVKSEFNNINEELAKKITLSMF